MNDQDVPFGEIQRFPNIAKVIVAILESKIETVLGKSAVAEIRAPLTAKEIEEKLLLAIAKAEARFISVYPDDDIAIALSQMKIADLTSIKLAIVSFFEDPSTTILQDEFRKQIHVLLPGDFPEEQVILATSQYFKIVLEEMRQVAEIREVLNSLSIQHIEDNTLESKNLLKSINEKLGVLIGKDIPTKASDKTSKRRYTLPASTTSPGLVLFLIDRGYHFNKMLVDNKTAASVVHDALRRMITLMVQRSFKGGQIAPRYSIGIFSYSSVIEDISGGIVSIDKLARLGIPRIEPSQDEGDTFEAFLYMENLIKVELQNHDNCPAPLICHITSGEYPGRNIEPIAQRIKSMAVEDGNILLENVLIEDRSTLMPNENPKVWPGIRHESELAKAYARQLFRMSSVLPESYRSMLKEYGYQLTPGSRMLYPGTHPEIISLAYTVSAVTTLGR